MNLNDDDIYLNGGALNLERQLDHKQSVKDISVHGERQKIVVTLEFAQKLLPLFGRRSIPSGVVARPYHTEEYAQSSRLARQVSQHPNR
ncbi:MAG: hypothetical protein ACE1ZK_01375 [Nitrospirales bacterium]